MNNKALKNRSEIPSEYKWNIDVMYPDENEVFNDLKSGKQYAESFAELQGSIMSSSDNLLKSIKLYEKSFRLLENALIYAHMKKDEDNSNSKYQDMNNRATACIAECSALCSFFVPELLESDEALLDEYLSENDGFKEYEFFLRQIFSKKAHSLSSEQEFILASLGEVLGSADDIFSALNDVDLSYGTVIDEDGEEVQITHGNFTSLLESEDAVIRKTTFDNLYNEYKKHNNSISTMYNSNVKTTVIRSKLRKYSSSLEAALEGDKIPTSVYHSLIDAVHKMLPAMHRYVKIRKRALKLDELHMWDVYKPLVKPTDTKYSFDDAVELACKALAPLGEEYVSVFRKGVTEEKWVDIYENKGKTSGAYSFGAYDSYPYILMNFNGELRDVFTLVHEGGHSMHSWYTRRTQPYIYGSHSIFTAEVASTVNETLLIHYLLKNCDDEDMRAYLVNFYIDEFKSTLFRQTMFAEFELKCHEAVESGASLTPDFLNETYDELNTLYFGDAMTHDDLIQYEWSRIPHFYRDFYVYQYATGYSAANAIAERILNGGEAELNDYLNFLKSGDSDYPIELLKLAGVDMSKEEPVLSALHTFEKLVDELDELV